MSEPSDRKNLLIADPAFERELERKMPEMVTLQRLIRSLEGRARVNIEDVVVWKGKSFPLVSVVMGSEDPEAPTLGVFGGVHGLERIGSDVVISWIQSLAEMMTWDASVRDRLKHSRLVFMPIVNPVGIYEMMRSNGNGVDLMRNSPIRADEEPWFLLGGQQYSNKIPWYSPRVDSERDMEIEARAVIQLVEREMFRSKVSLSVDVHSGFGSVDRFWFPWAKSKSPPPHIEEITALKRLYDRSYPNHFYQIEPQAKSYTTHGDLWDWLYEKKIASDSKSAKTRSEKATTSKAVEKKTTKAASLFVPFTLELGSWLWLKKNPRQIFSSLGGFHPMQPHRLKRILRRHMALFDFLHRAVLNAESWIDLDSETRDELRRRAHDLWYADEKKV